MTEHTTTLHVRYAETDAMGVAHHANYPVWFEVGRTDLMRALGLPYTEVEARGFYLMLSDLGVQYRRAARYDDALTLRTRVEEVRSRRLIFAYDLTRTEADGSVTLIAAGRTVHTPTDKQYRVASIPEDVLALLRG
ncbi:acyl-CoA thioesterase [Deinococcus maricopensis]|uniref:4-hydroxybenzoyl-CoA thioesterase n=1 Tax=Deinococcus maricopensis (strain DSM 21211 / LMG 22137 / NRRL B-23946 / LB-34) TaxID=709986 RepID=E8U6J8_DEIML|nr:thioesterase family protein [Deinococcus maricopensis]ADV66687.1 4-hydroxybenzoyl-CoA thioesterase [Deinococcus maricopensis DSM 21211]